jgi:tRNA(fMet)-specific endonuclease VapC
VRYGRRPGRLPGLRVVIVSLLGFGAAEAEAAAGLRARLQEQGCPIGPLENLLAGTALAHGLVLVTHNTREFARIEGLQLEDWY